jgi:hypothetical protein
VTLLLDWLLGDQPTHISDVVYRDHIRQYVQSQETARSSGNERRARLMEGDEVVAAVKATSVTIQKGAPSAA